MARHLRRKKNRLLSVLVALAGCLLMTAFTYENVRSPVISAGQAGEKRYREEPVPTLYIHGWHGTANSTNHLIESAERQKGAEKVLRVEVSPEGKTTYYGNWKRSVRHPIVQVVFDDNEAEIPDEAVWLGTITSELRARYGVSRFNVVSHSMGGPVTLYWALHLRRKNSPRLQKFVPIAGPFDGVIFTDDVPNQNRLRKSGEPVWQNDAYRSYYAARKNFPKGVSVLNIFGNLEDGTNADYLVTNVSARSLGWLVRGRAASYEEKMITGPQAQHSRLHENPQVDRLVNYFLY